MKKVVFASLLVSLVVLNSCKKKEETTTTGTETTTVAPDSETPTSAEPKTFTVTATPEIATLGKDKQLTLKIINLKAIELSNAEGAVTGIELSYDYQATNNGKIGSSGIVVDPNDFRLELDNGTKISHSDYDSGSVDAEASKTVSGNKFTIPGGSKPVSLNLFYNETRAVVKIELK